MSTPTVLYRNLLYESNQGRGDGTIYAFGTTAVPTVADKTFVLTTVNIMDDLGADTDDLFNGYILKFDASEREYLVIDWDASSDLATTLDVPNAEDVGDWILRRVLYTVDFDPDNPVEHLQDGLLFQKWIDSGANKDATIQVAAPNGIDDGGFELNSLTDFWIVTQGGTGTVAINAVSPILGTYDCKLSVGDQSDVGIEQNGKIDLRTGYTYGLTLKAGGDGGQVIGCWFFLEYAAAGDSPYFPLTFTRTAAGSTDNIQNGGNGVNNIWIPRITDVSAREEVTFTVPENINAGDWVLKVSYLVGVDLFIDEIYLWEIGPTGSTGGAADQSDTLIIAGHNMAGGFAAGSDVRGLRCQADLSNYDSTDPSDDMDILIDLDAVTVDGNFPIHETFTASVSIFPIMEINLAAVSGKTWEAAQIHIGKTWVWDAHVTGDWRPNAGEIEVASSVSLSGIRRVSRKFDRRLFSGQVRGLSAEQYGEWLAFIDYVLLDLPFWFTTPAINNRGIVAELLFMRNSRRPELSAQFMVAMHASFRFEEVLGGSN